MAGYLRGKLVPNDVELLEWRRETRRDNQLPPWKRVPFDIIVLDEFQDCTEVLFWLICCSIRANQLASGGQPPRLVVLGDERQSIFRFRGADARYLTCAPDLLSPLSPYSWDIIPLDQSFRLSRNTVGLINDGFLGGQQVVTSSKEGPKPILIQCDPFESPALVKELLPLIDQYGAHNTAILAPSVPRNWPLRQCVNQLAAKHHIPIAVSTNDEIALNDKVIQGKMCVSTFHQFKGVERPLVIVLGVDASYFRYYARHLPCDKCPNEVFVALTRASEQLVLVHNHAEEHMPFVSVEALHEKADVINLESRKKAVKRHETPSNLPPEMGVRNMTRHMRAELSIEMVADYLVIEKLNQDEELKFPEMVLSNPKRGHYEAVSDLNGLVAVAACEFGLAGTFETLKIDQKPTELGLVPPSSSQEYVAYFYQRACSYEGKQSGYRPRGIQLKNHKFKAIKPDTLARAQNRLREQLEQMKDSAAEIRFEHQVEEEFTIDDNKIVLRGKADAVGISPSLKDGGREIVTFLVEAKLVSSLCLEHAVQASIYAYLSSSGSEEVPHTILYNVRNGEKWLITPRHGREGLRSMIEAIMRDKMRNPSEMSDDEFDRKCEETRQEVLGADGPMG